MTLYTLHHPTLFTLRFTLHSPHSSLCTLHATLYTLHSTLYIVHFTLYTLHFTLYTFHSTLYTLHFTLYTPHLTLYALYALHFTLHNPPLHTLHTTFPTQHSTIFTLHTSQSAPFHTHSLHWYGHRGKYKIVENIFHNCVLRDCIRVRWLFFSELLNCCHCFSIFGFSDNISTFQPLKVKSWELHIWKLGWFPVTPALC